LRDLALSALGEFHRAHPLRAGMSREELRGRVGAVDERLFAYLLSTLEAAGALHVERDKVHLASHAVRLSLAQQRILDEIEAEFRRADAAPPSAEEALSRAGVTGDENHELFQLLVANKTLVRVKESLYFHVKSLDAIRGRVVDLLHDRKEISPGDVKDL